MPVSLLVVVNRKNQLERKKKNRAHIYCACTRVLLQYHIFAAQVFEPALQLHVIASVRGPGDRVLRRGGGGRGRDAAVATAVTLSNDAPERTRPSDGRTSAQAAAAAAAAVGFSTRPRSAFSGAGRLVFPHVHRRRRIVCAVFRLLVDRNSAVVSGGGGAESA